VIDKRGLAPEGWQIPNVKQWDELIRDNGGPKLAGLMLKSKKYWEEASNGLDSCGFCVLPSGYKGNSYTSVKQKIIESNEFRGIGSVACFWSLGNTWNDGSICHYEFNRGNTVYQKEERSSSEVGMGYSVRCVRELINKTVP
jgi:uncharacterized protein (TIGR02145 family)